MRTPAGLIVHIPDSYCADMTCTPRRLNRHRSYQIRIFIQNLFTDLTKFDGMVGFNQGIDPPGQILTSHPREMAVNGVEV